MSWNVKYLPEALDDFCNLRIVYQVVVEGNNMLVIVIGAREDDEVYEIVTVC
ncbi:MAG: hypothetical protein ACI3ZR_06170 [bacterium]